MRRATRRIVSGINGRPGPKRDKPPRHEDFRETEIRRLHADYRGTGRFGTDASCVPKPIGGGFCPHWEESSPHRCRRSFCRNCARRNAARVIVARLLKARLLTPALSSNEEERSSQFQRIILAAA